MGFLIFYTRQISSVMYVDYDVCGLRYPSFEFSYALHLFIML